MKEFSPVFWQYLAVAEISARKSRAILDSLEASSLDPVAFLLGYPQLSDPERQRMQRANMDALRKAIASGATVWAQPDYPVSNPEDFPPVLFRWGNPEALDRPGIAIVGTRSTTPYGVAVAQKFAECFASAGASVVSGGAAGIDAAAHEGALAGKGSTIAVLACGVDRVYPAQHVGLYQRMRENGLLVSQYGFGQPTREYSFSARNITIAALSDAVVVIEAPEKSGALRTAHAAADQGKPVFVVPGNITQFSFRGSHALIRDGALLVDHPSQVLEALGLEPTPEVTQKLEGNQARIAELLAQEPHSAEKIVEKTGLDITEVLVELTELEMDGRILRVGLGYALKP